MSPTLRQLEAFVAVCDEGSFHAAAQRINASPSSLSALIRELESQLGSTLFNRTTRRVSLTQAADVLREPAVRALRDVERGTSLVKALVARKMGRVTVAAPPLLTAELIVPAAHQLRSRYPDIVIRIMDLPSADIPKLIQEGIVDVGFGAVPAPNPELITRPLLEGPLYALLPKNNALSKLHSISLLQVTQQGLVLQHRGSPFRDELDRIFVQNHITPRVEFEVTHFSTIFSMVEHGFGLSIMPPYTPIVPGGRQTVVRPISTNVTLTEISMIRSALRELPNAAEAFCEIATEFVSTSLPSSQLKSHKSSTPKLK